MSNFSMRDLFGMEVETQAAILNENLLTLENQPQSPQELESLMRAAHSIKGAARIVEIDAAVKVAHGMEDCFVAAQAGTITLETDQIDVLLSGVDFLLRISQVPETDFDNWLWEQEEEIEALVVAIAAILEVDGVEEAEEAEGAGEAEGAEGVGEAEGAEGAGGAEGAEGAGEAEGAEETGDVEEVGIVEASIDAGVSIETVSSQELLVVAPKTIPPTPPEQPQQLPSEEIQEPTSVIPTQKLTSVEPTLQTSHNTDRVVRVSAENLNRLMGLAGESLVEANWLQPFVDSLLKLKKTQGELASILEKLQESVAESTLNQLSTEHLRSSQKKANECQEILSDRLIALELFVRRSANLSDRLYREVIASHMRPFSDGVNRFHRMIRDLAKELGKQAKLEIIGTSTQVDRDILEKLEAPLTHILRNSIDHGIEFPQERLAVGKSAKGTVRLEASHRAGMLSITVSDDGKGIDLEQLRQKIVHKQLVTSEMAHQLTEHELMEFLFLPGFSTAHAVTEISGRGVGLDIAKSMVEEVGGTLRAISQPGQGMNFHFQLPLTLSVIRTLLVEISGEPYAFPLTRIEQIVMVEQAEIAVVENRQYFKINEHNIGLIVAQQVLELPEFTANGTQNTTSALPVVIISDHFNRYGVVVDRFLGERDLVVRPLEPRLGKIPDISAAALMEDGSPLLIIDVADLVRSIDNLLNEGRLSQIHRETDITVTTQQKNILVVDDSITVREMERKLLENKGYKVELAVNGMEGWNAVRTGDYDLVITDIDMPRMNGIELVKQIKSHTQLNSIPVIIVSYKDREEDRIRGLDAGADYYLTKSSFHDDSLLNAVVDLIEE
ncbi:MAG: hybrid sensor histidine kinase/response regulator [Symploca sp. SIO1B1]|nr:hybrid sensor histidine kinase/response regulator [Symploca sp. SIO1B1]